MIDYKILKVGDTLYSHHDTKMRVFNITDQIIHLIDEKHYLKILKDGMTDNLMIEYVLYFNDEEDMQWLGNYRYDK
jgi:hypothetical protein